MMRAPFLMEFIMFKSVFFFLCFLAATALAYPLAFAADRAGLSLLEAPLPMLAMFAQVMAATGFFIFLSEDVKSK
jgi:hypothetical protein